MNAAPSRRQAQMLLCRQACVLLRRQAAARMPAASRALRLGLAIVALGSSAACTKPAGPAPFATMPAPPDADAAASQPASMTERVAIDAALAAALVGAWSESVTIDGTAFDTLITYAADRTLTLVITPKDQKQAAPKTFAGTWSIQNGFLNTRLAGDTSPDTPDEILKISVNEFLYRSGDDKTTRVATRRTAPVAALPVAAITAAPTAPAAPAEPPEPAPFADETRFVAQQEVEFIVFRLNEAAQVRLLAEIEERVPLNVIVLSGRITETRFVQAFGNLTYGAIVPLYEDSKIKGVNTVGDLFANRLSKRSARQLRQSLGEPRRRHLHRHPRQLDRTRPGPRRRARASAAVPPPHFMKRRHTHRRGMVTSICSSNRKESE